MGSISILVVSSETIIEMLSGNNLGDVIKDGFSSFWRGRFRFGYLRER
jgi:hypothetical protein